MKIKRTIGVLLSLFMLVQGFPVSVGIVSAETYSLNTVSFYDDANNLLESLSVADNETVGEGLPAVPARTGYTGIWWSEGSEFTASTVVTADRTVTAVYTPKQFNVYFKDGATLLDTVPTNFGATASSTAYPIGYVKDVADTHYTLSRWSPTPTITSEADLTVQAIWEEAEYDVTFVDENGTGLYPEQHFVLGEKVVRPADPPLPAGATSFLGWYKDGVLYDFNKIVTSSFQLVAEFKYTYTVKFKVDNSIWESVEVAPGGLVTDPGTPPMAESNYHFTEWQLGGTAYNFSAPVTSDLTILAAYDTVYYVSYDTGDAPMLPTEVVSGNVPVRPTNPTRAGYTFDHWETADGTTYNFNTPVTADVQLYAVWNPAKTSITIVVWKEADGQGAESAYATYDYTYSEQVKILSTAANAPVSDSAITMSGRNLYAGTQHLYTLPADDAGNYLYYQYKYNTTSSVTVNGDGSTVVNMYYTRKYYRVYFNLNYAGATMTVNGTTYTNGGTQYSIRAKLDEYILDRWPSRGNPDVCTIPPVGSYVLKGWQWDASLNITTLSTSNQLTVTSRLCDQAKTDNPMTGVWATSLVKYYLMYMFEALPGESTAGKITYTTGGITYVLNEEYTQPVWGATYFSSKAIGGMVAAGTVTNEEDLTTTTGTTPFAKVNLARNTYWPGTTTGRAQFLLYKRERGYIELDVNGATGVTTSTSSGASYTKVSNEIYRLPNDITAGRTTGNVPFEALLAQFMPTANPVKTGYVFGGWYMEPELLTPFTLTRMPSGNLKLWAKWVLAPVPVKFYLSETATGTYANKTVPVNTTVTGVTDPADSQTRGVFMGWYYKPFPTEMPNYTLPFVLGQTKISEATDVYADWKTTGFTVTYDPNGGTGSVVDSHEYGLGVSVVVQSGESLTYTDQAFIGWKIQGGDSTIYYETDTFKIYSDTVLVAQWQPRDSVVIITYHSNYPDGSPDVIRRYLAGTTAAFAGNIFSYPGNTLLGWRTSPDGPVIYTLNEPYTFTESMDLYAVWLMPELTVQKAVTSIAPHVPNYDLGDVVSYSVVVTNTGNGTVTGITLSDPLMGAPVTIGTLAPGESSAAVTYTHTVTETDLAAGHVVNTARAAGKDDNGNDVIDSDTETVTTEPFAPQLTVEKKNVYENWPASLGEIFTFSIVVTNSGNETVTDITLSDPRMGAPVAIGTLAPGESAAAVTYTYTVTEADLVAGYVENTATATGKDGKDNDVTGTDTEVMSTDAFEPRLNVEKYATYMNQPGGYQLGDEISFSIIVTNVGNETLTGIMLSDMFMGSPVPIGTLAPGESAPAVTYTYTVTLTDYIGGAIMNTANATGKDRSGNDVTATDTEYVYGAPLTPTLSVSKITAQTEARAGEDITYSIDVTNSGLGNAIGVKVTEYLPTNATFKSASTAVGAYDELTGVWNLGNLAAGATASLTIVLTVSDTAANGDNVVNSVAITEENGILPWNQPTSEVSTPVKNPSLSIEKSTEQTEIRAGEDITYTITVTNSGLGDATDVKVTESLPTNAMFKSASTATGTYDELTGIWDLGDLAVGGTATLTVVVTANNNGDGVCGGDLITNSVAITEENGNPQTGLFAQATTMVVMPSLVVHKVVNNADYSLGDTPIVRSNQVAFQIQVMNIGNGVAKDVAIKDDLDWWSGFHIEFFWEGNFTSFDPTDYADWLGDTSVLRIGDLAPGEWVDVSYMFTDITTKEEWQSLDKYNQVVQNTVFIAEENGVSYDMPNPNAVDYPPPNWYWTPYASTDFIIRDPLVSIDKSTEQTEVRAGEDIAYTITVTNSGEGNAAFLKVTETLPANATFKSANIASGSYDSVTGLWNIGDLAAGGTATLQLVLTANDDVVDGDTILNRAAITEEGYTGPYTPITVEVETPVKNPNLAISKTTAQTEVRAGEDITYTVTVTNSGLGDATGVKVTESLPTNATFKSATPVSGTYDPATNIWTVGDLAAGATATLTIVLTVSADVTDGDTVVNSVAITEENGETPTSPPTDETETPVQNPGLKISKTTTQTEVRAGEDITYTVTVTNSGLGDATGVKVTETLPTNATFKSATPSSGTYDPATKVWTVGNLTVGSTATLTVVLTVSDDAADGDTVANAVAITEENGETPTNPPIDETETPVENPNLAIFKSTAQADVRTDEDITYTVTVTNSGLGDAKGVKVTETIPAIATFKSATPVNGTYDPTTNVWMVGDLAAGATATLMIVLTVNDDVTGGDTVVNAVSITEENGETPENPPTSKMETPILKPELTVEKLVTSVTPAAGYALGDVISYSVVVTNTGNETVTGITLTDPLMGAPVTIGTLAPGAKTAAVTYTHVATEADLALGQVANTATATGKDGDNHDVTDTDAKTVTTEPLAPALTVEKTVTSTEPVGGYALGDAISYGVVVTNTGNETVTGITLSDPLMGAPITIGTLAPGAKAAVVTYTHVVTEADLTAGQVQNTATATGKDGNNNDVTGTDTETVTTEPFAPELTVEKTVTSTEPVGGYALGDAISYSVVVTNTGNETVTGITLSDPLMGAPVTIGTLSPGAKAAVITYTHVVTEADLATGQVENTATATGKDGNNNDVTDTDTKTVTTEPLAPALTVEKTVTSTEPVGGYALGDVISYSVVVTNSGNETVTGITLSDPLMGAPITIGTLSPGAKAAVVTYSHMVTEADLAAGQVENTATATGKDGNNNDVTDTDTKTVTTEPLAPALTVEKTVTSTEPVGGYALGDVISYSVVVTNTGNETVTGITLSDLLMGAPVTIGTLAPGAKAAVITYTHMVTEADLATGQVENTATATGKDGNNTDVTGTDTETVTTEPFAPELTVEKKVTSTQPAGGYALGDVISYSVVVTNTGNETVTGITLSDPLMGEPVTIGTLSPGAKATVITYTHMVTETDLTAGQVENTATAMGKDGNNTDVTGTDTETVTTEPFAPALTVEKTVTNTEPVGGYALGDVIFYSVVVTNIGNETVTGITLSDSLMGAPVTIGSLLPGASAMAVKYTYTVTETDLAAGHVVNIATATGKDGNGDDVTGTDTETVTTELLAPELMVEKTVTSSTPTAGYALGDVISYSVVVTNSGNETVTGITLNDPLMVAPVTLGSLTPGASAVAVTYTHVVTEIDIATGHVENTATATGKDGNNNDVTGMDTETVTTEPLAPELTVVKTVTSTTPIGGYALGNIISYSVVVTNSGNGTVSGITLSDPLMGALVTIGTLAPGESATPVTYTHTVTEADLTAGQVVNTATATGQDSKGNDVTDTDTKTEPPVPFSPMLTVEKTVTSSLPAGGYALGDVISYSVVVTNSGNATLFGITLHDPLMSTPVTIGTLMPGESAAAVTYTYTVTEADLAVGQVANTATSTGKDSGNRTVTGTDTETVTTEPLAPELTVEKTATSTAPVGGYELGDEITYSVVVTNSGNETITGITLSDPLMGELVTIGTLAPGMSTAAVTYTYTVTEADLAAGLVENTATAAGKDGSDSDVTGTDTETVATEPFAPELTVVKTVMGAEPAGGYALGDVIVYSVVVTNSGNETITGITLSDPLMSAPVSIGTLAPGASAASVMYTYVVTEADLAAGQVANIVTVAGKDGNNDDVTDTDTKIVTTEPLAPALTVEKTVTSTAPAGGYALGDFISYSVVVTNTGNETVTGITLSDPLMGAPVTIGTLAPGAKTSATTYTHVVTEADLAAGEVANTATATGKDGNNADVTDTDTKTVTTEPLAPALTVEKTVTSTAPAGGYALGDSITYSIVVTNTGNETVTGITLSDPLMGAPVTIGTLAPGAKAAVITYTHMVTEADLAAGEVANTATATGKDGNNDDVTDTDTKAVTTEPLAPALTVEKTVTSAEPVGGFALGDVISYSVVVTNTGNETVTGITLSDPLMSAPVTIGTLAPGAKTAAVTYTHVVTEADLAVGQVENTATATGKDGNGDDVTGTDTETVTTELLAPALTVEKTVTNTEPVGGYALGDAISYSVVVTNTGNETVTGITLSDPLMGAPVTIGTLAPGAKTAAVIYTHVVTEADLAVGQVENTATATGKDGNNADVTGTDTETVTTEPLAPALTVEKTVTSAEPVGGFALGDVIAYSVVVMNTGNETVTGITLSDPLMGAPVTIGTLAPGAKTTAATYTHVVTEADLAAGEVANTATATGKDGNNADVTDTDTKTVTTEPLAPALTVEKTVTSTAPAGGYALGDSITYSIVVTNTGNETVTGITLSDALMGAPVTIGTLAPGARAAAVKYTYVVTEADLAVGEVSNTATATGKDGTNHDVTGTDTERAATEPFAPALTVEKTVTSTQPADGYALDDVIAYSIVVTNSGNETVTGITLSDALMGTPVTIGTLAPGASAAVVNYTYMVTVADILAGGVANSATATGKDGNNNDVTATDTETVTTEPPSPELSITKTTAQTEVRAGEDITYVITVTNSGLTDATGVKVTENLPTNATFKSAATASGSYTSGTGLWDLGNLAVGGTATLTLVLTANANVANGDTVANTVAITEENGATPENPLTDETEIPVKNPNLTITKATTQSGVRAGEDITYVITVTNSGLGDAKGVKVTEHLPSNATFWGASTATGTYSLITNIWTVGDLAAGETATLIISLVVNDDVTDGETVVNTVEITEENGETLQNPPTDETDTLVKMPVLIITKRTSQTQVQAGEDITYIITVTNNGHSEASGVVVTETLPTNATYKSHTATAGVYDTQTAKWTIDMVATEGGFETLTLTLTINGNAQEGLAINHVIITEVDGNSNPNEPEDTVVTPIRNPALRIVKSASVPNGNTLASAGGKLTYNIQVFNDGQAGARNCLITDLVPTHCTFVSASCADAASINLDIATNTLRCEIAELAAGQNATIVVTVNVSAWSQIGTRTISNTAKLYFQNATLDSNTVQHLQTNTDSSDVPVTGENENVLIILLMIAALLVLAGTLTWLVSTHPKRNK